MIAILVILTVAFLIGPRTFQAVMCYCLGYFNILYIPLKILTVFIWIVLVYVPEKVYLLVGRILPMTGQVQFSYGASQSFSHRSGYPEFDSDFSSGL